MSVMQRIAVESRPHVVVLGNEKGGSGKSTAAMHVIVGLMREGYRVAAIDLDARQGTLMRHLEARAAFAAARGIACRPVSDTDLDVLTDPDELGLIRKLSAYPEVLQASALAFEPHRVTYYLQQLAALLHTFYNKHRILPPASDQDGGESSAADTPSPEVTAARLVLMRGVQQVLRNGLAVLGISAPDQM